MRSRPAFIYALFFATVLVAASDPTLAAAKHKTTKTVVAEAADPIKDATVNLYCRLKAGKKILSSSGSGVVIDPRGIVLTNAHVAQYFLLAGEKGRVTGWCSVRTGSPAKEAYTAEVLYFPLPWLEDNLSLISKNTPKGTGENDFALLYITSAKKGALPVTFPSLSIGTVSEASEGEPVTIAGYPIEKLEFDEIRNKLARVVASSTLSQVGSFDSRQPDLLTLAASRAGMSGVSGGPIVDENTRVIGIVTSKSATRTTGETGAAVRGISLSYIDRMIREQTGLPLASLLSDDLAARVALTRSLIPTETITALMNGLRKKK